ncbi:type I polyketide synthase [Acephala macrosclerotiorum]|nr:type I polyketide synthase [Acephala macrosclerotiorum]
MSCRFPGEATSPEKLWQLCADAKSAWSHFLKQDIALFDAPFFNVSHEEAKAMDPQLRLQLESCYEALENAGIPIEQIAGTKTAVFSGIFTKDYTEGMLRDVETLPRYYVTGTGTAMLSNRISYFFDLKGPSLTVDTGCSTSLVALHLACQSIRSGESEAALVGGSNVIINPDLPITLANMGFLSSEGKSYAFDHRASGYGRGEGVACIVIKPLDKALRDGDYIHSVIRQRQLTQMEEQMESHSQVRWLMNTYFDAHTMRPIYPFETDYVECHGIGTQAGDPLELQAVGKVFGGTRTERNPVYIGSVKTNVGHLEAASGLAGVIKASMAMQRGIIPPNINFEKVNDKIPLDKYHLKVPLQQTPWPASEGPRRASVNSLGYGGTNAHVVLEHPKTLTTRSNGYSNGCTNGHSNSENGHLSDDWRIFTFSAKDEEAVYDTIANTRAYLETHKVSLDSSFLSNLAYTLGQRRSAFRWVQAIPANSPETLMKALEGRRTISTRKAESPRIGFVFTGQGAQWHAMGRELINAYPIFRRTLQQAEDFLKTQGYAKTSQVNTATIGQPLCTAIQIALVKLLESWNIKPTAVTGHSSALSAVAQKISKLTGIQGGMIAVGLSRKAVVVACINSPSNVTVSGDLAAIDELQGFLDKDGVFGRKLKVNTAYHSHHILLAMDGYLDKLEQMNTTNQLSDPVTSPKELGPTYWVQNAVQPVLFSDALISLCRGGASEKVKDIEQFVDVLVEIGPHGTLGAPIRQIMQHPSLAHIDQDAVESMQIMASSLLLKGLQVNLQEINFPKGSHSLKVFPDLPSYPWSHKTKYWHEPRVNRQQRQRLHARHDLLGVLSPDHVVDSNILYPAAGFVAMTIEAVSQTHNSLAAETAGFRVHEMRIMNALVVPESTDGVEVQISLFPSSDHLPRAQHSYEFKVLSVVGLELKSVVSEASWKQSSTGSSQAAAFKSSEEMCTQSIDTTAYYESVARLGISYGESFQNLVHIAQGPLRSLATVEIRDTAALMPAQVENPHIIHPTTLDAIFQSIYPALAENGTEHKSIMIPTFVKSLYVSQDIISTPGSRLKISTNAGRNGTRGAKASLVVAAEGDANAVAVVEIDELVLSSVGSSVEETKNKSSNLCFKVSFDRDISFMTLKDFAAISGTHMDLSELKVAADLQRACFHLVERALDELTDADRLGFTGHVLSMYNWMVAQHELGQQGKLDCQDATWLKSSIEEQDKLIEKVESETVNGEMCVRVGRHLVQILRKDIEPLEVMMEGNLLYKYYENALGMKRIYAQMSKLLRLFAHKNPGAAILEIGGGTGGCTVPALQALTDPDDGIPRFARYDFTDISSGFFEKAKEKLAEWEDRVDFKKFDIEVDAKSQDVKVGQYDLVLACNVSHATANMDKTMSNVRKLLKPGGRLLIVEGTRDTLDVSLVFGILPGWWLGQEQERRLSPKLPITAWDKLLKRTGFAGQEALMLDAPKERDHTKKKEHPPTSIVFGQEKLSQDFLDHLSSSIQSLTGSVPAVARFQEAEVAGKFCIFVAEMDDPILAGLDQDGFLALRQMLTSAKGVLWVTVGGTMESSKPEAAMVTGLVRTLRTENAGIRYVTIESAATIFKIFESTFDSVLESANIDFEYTERNGQILIPRVLPDPGANKAIIQNGDFPSVEDQAFHQEDRPLLLEVDTAGLMDTMRFVDDLEHGQPLPDDFVEVAPKAFGLNFRDVMIAMGQLNETIMGYECAGVITRVGKSVTHLKVGDRVAAMMRGHYANYIRLLGIAVSKVPDEISWEEATSIPMKGETVLIHAAAGGVGQAAIMLAQLVGAEVYATVGSKEKAQLIMDTYGIPEDHIFSSRNAFFATEIMAATNGKGVDVALNSLSGQLFHVTWKCMAMFGRMIEIGKRDIEINTRLEMSGFQGNVSFSAIDLTYMGRFRPAHLTSILEKCMQLASEGKIHAVKPVTVYPISEIERAFRFMQAGKHMGKVVIKPNEDDIVKVLARRKRDLFRADSSYIIVGGLGGLGQSLSRWMVKHGARNLIILSRSGKKHALAEKLSTNLEQAGCKAIMPACDIKDSILVEQILTKASKSMPPIRGLIQGAMVLNDCVFEHMSFEQYQNAALLKHQLDDFVMLSSAVGIVGNSSQANYAAGSSFLNALSQHRRSLGLPALSLDLGIINSVGYVAENAEVAKRLARMGHDSISEDRMLALIELAIADSQQNKRPSQIVTGLSTRELDAAWIQDSKFAILRQTRSAGASSHRKGAHAQKASLGDHLSTVKSLADAKGVLCEAIISKLANNLMVSDAYIDPEQSITACGVDSLVAVELRNWLLGQTGAEISVVDLLQNKSIFILSDNIAKKSKVVAKSLSAE